MHVMSFSEIEDLSIDRDTLFQRLIEDAPATGGQTWQPLPGKRGAVMHTERPSARNPARLTTTDTTISFNPTPMGTRVQMDVTMSFGGAPGRALILVRPTARRRLHTTFCALILALQTGDVAALHEESRRNQRTVVRARTAQLVFLLLLATQLGRWERAGWFGTRSEACEP
jgi:hypothetical protein